MPGTLGAMSEHPPQGFERRRDVAVVGGSAAGLAAALQLVRQRRSVIVVDDGTPRNLTAEVAHGYLGHDGVRPGELVAAGRAEVRRYGGEVVTGRVLQVARTEEGELRLELTGGHAVVARRVLAATGCADELPDLDGLAAHWGSGVVHCPFCHGDEVGDRRVVQVVTHPAGLHTAPLFWRLAGQLTIVLHGAAGADAGLVDGLRAAGVEVLDATVRRVVTGVDGAVAAVELDGGRRLPADVVAVGPRWRVRVAPFTGLGLEPAPHPSGLGDVVEVDATGATSVPGLFAAGNLTDPSRQLLLAAADGSRVGAMIAVDLAEEDLRAGPRPSAAEADWDHRYAGAPLWSGNPNGALVVELAGATPGRALDVGAGEGGDALWLARQGWKVTASDISRRGLDRLAAAARQHGLDVECLHADANAIEPFAPGAFDLVSAHYASIPRTPDRRAVRNLLAAVAPDGTLLVVGHDLGPMRAPLDVAAASRPFDPDAYVRVDDVAEVLAGEAGWEVQLHEIRPRPPGAASAGHHVDDVVLRARRRR